MVEDVEAQGVDRILGSFGPVDRGPTLIVVSGIHGNEPAGVRASQAVRDRLRALEPRMRGRVHLVVANLAAVRAGVRYVDRDLNRAWTSEQISLVRNGHPPEMAEDREQRDLLERLESWVATAPGPVYMLDLHTTSGPGAAFSTVADRLENRRLALRLPVPMVLGLEEMVVGTLHDYLQELGVVTLAFESGQHAEPQAVDRAEAAIWLVLAAAGLLQRGDAPEIARARRHLSLGHERLPRVVEMRYRHPVAPGDEFRMRDGYLNFQPVEKGEAVARDRDGDVRIPESARILMPLYQEQGNDGFFVVREFRPIWLRISAALRHARVDRVIHWLPGIRRHPDDPDALIVNRTVARWYAQQILHLLGFRRVVDLGATLVMHRR